MLHRRQFLQSAAAATSVLGLSACDPLQSLYPSEASLNMQQAQYNVLQQSLTNGMVSLSANAPPPVLRAKQGVPFFANVTNSLPDYTTMHWHGIRLPNTMDGVPYLTQFPLREGETFRYAFTPPDAGTYWYHPHCMTMELMALGLTGALIVDEAEDPGFDDDITVNLRDFRLGDDGQFKELFTPRGAARGGTHGTVMTANWDQDPVYEARAGGLTRLRVIATDITRIYKLFLPDTKGQIIAMDGHPVATPVPWPTAAEPLTLSPGQRVDFALEMPEDEEQEIKLMAEVRGVPKSLARLRTSGQSAKHRLSDLAPLIPNLVPEPDLANAEPIEFVFGWSPSGDLPNNGLCGTLGYTFWSINRTAWQGDASGAGPLATLKQGRSYILRLRNESPNVHPIHLHGLTFKPIRSNKRKVLPNWTDTALLLKEETLDVALVADNPGDWAFHCHVIEHQKTGLAGYLRVA
jgi:FtsP/CotA-like multicopper oxidase with cupredoxin domain